MPPVSADLVFPPGTSEISFEWLADELARLAGVELVYGPDVRQSLERNSEKLEQTASVPADEVYGFVEALLASRGFALALTKTGTPTLLEILDPAQAVRGTRTQVPAVVAAETEIDALARHPALLAQTSMTFHNIDSRQLQTQLRQLLVDASGMTNVVPAGERSLLIQGPGVRVASLVQLLREVDRLSGALVLPETQAEQAAAPR
ncbi:MAG: hypothetical protein ABL998_08500 [Planctomycetota bacterium]